MLDDTDNTMIYIPIELWTRMMACDEESDPDEIEAVIREVEQRLRPN